MAVASRAVKGRLRHTARMGKYRREPVENMGLVQVSSYNFGPAEQNVT